MALTRDYAAEQAAPADALKSTAEGGANTGIPAGTTDVADLPDATRQLIQEQVNMRVYGTGNPDFGTTSTTTTQTTQTQAQDEQTTETRPVVYDTGTMDTTTGATSTQDVTTEALQLRRSERAAEIASTSTTLTVTFTFTHNAENSGLRWGGHYAHILG